MKCFRFKSDILWTYLFRYVIILCNCICYLNREQAFAILGCFLTGATSPPDPTEHQIHMAIVGINNAQTEAQAAKAAAAIYSPALDLSDNVKQTLENKIRQLRTPPGWAHPIPPPLPFGFDVMHVIMNAYYGTVTTSPIAAGPPAPAAPVMPNPGPPTSIRRGPSPGKRRSSRNQQNAWQQTNSWSAASTWDSGTGINANAGIGSQQQGGFEQTNSQQQSGGADWTPLASSNSNWINPFDFYDPNAYPSVWI